MFSAYYLERCDRDVAIAKKNQRLAQLMVVVMSCALVACATVQRAVSECVTGNKNAERVVATALSESEPHASLENVAKRMGIEVVTCALWSIVRSLTANAQASSSVEGHQPDAWTARREQDQPKVEAARRWLSEHGQTAEPTWRR